MRGISGKPIFPDTAVVFPESGRVRAGPALICGKKSGVMKILVLSILLRPSPAVTDTLPSPMTEVIVVGTRTQNQKKIDISKAGIAAMDLPQSVAVVDKEVLGRQQALTVGDALMNVNGIYVMGTTGGVQQEIGGRGYLFNSTNTFKNGMKFNNGVTPDLSAVERLEFLKGSAAILMGNVTAGGVMNIVTRKPQFQQGGELSFRAGSYDFYKPVLDIYGPAGGSPSVAYRVVSAYEKERSFRDFVRGERFYINPSFLIKAGKKVQVLVEGDYLNDTHTSDFGIGAINYRLIPIPRSRFLGAPWSTNKASEGNITVTTTVQLNDRWQLRSLDGFYDYTVDLYGTTRPDDGGVRRSRAMATGCGVCSGASPTSTTLWRRPTWSGPSIRGASGINSCSGCPPTKTRSIRRRTACWRCMTRSMCST
jgi:outer membrane receptor protein involved in Fe transport